MLPEAESLLSEALMFKDVKPKTPLATRSLVVDATDGHLGVTLTNHPLGVLLQRVDELDAAHQSGLRAGDVIVSVDGCPTKDHRRAAELLFAPGARSLTYIPAQLADAEMVARRRPTEFVAIALGEDGHMGLTLSDHPLGVLVDAVYELDMAYKAGLRAGDVIVTLNGRAVVFHEAACEIIHLAQLETEHEVRMTYHRAEDAAVELVVTSSYGPRGSHLPGHILSSSLSSHTTKPPTPPDTPLPSQRMRSLASQRSRPQASTHEGSAPGGACDTDRLTAGFEMNYSYTSTTTSSKPVPLGAGASSGGASGGAWGNARAGARAGARAPIMPRPAASPLRALEEEDVEEASQLWLGLDEEDDADLEAQLLLMGGHGLHQKSK